MVQVEGTHKVLDIFDNPTMADNNGVERTGIFLVLSFQSPWPAAHPER